MPWNMSVGVNTSWRSGTPTTTTAYYNGVDFFPNGRNDMGRTKALTQTDLFIAQPVKIGGFGFEVNLNVINLFDEDSGDPQVQLRVDDRHLRRRPRAATGSNANVYFWDQLVPYDVDTLMGPANDPYYGKAYAWQAARTVRLGLKFTF